MNYLLVRTNFYVTTLEVLLNDGFLLKICTKNRVNHYAPSLSQLDLLRQCLSKLQFLQATLRFVSAQELFKICFLRTYVLYQKIKSTSMNNGGILFILLLLQAISKFVSIKSFIWNFFLSVGAGLGAVWCNLADFSWSYRLLSN